MTTPSMLIYELSFNIRLGLAAHSLSNVGSNGTNRLLGRRILLADGVEADGASGNIFKRSHRVLTAEYLPSFGQPLCLPCAVGDGRGAAGLSATEQGQGHPVTRCGVCDIHGYMIPPRANEAGSEDEGIASAEAQSERTTIRANRTTNSKAARAERSENGTSTKQSRPSLVEFSFAIGDPAHQAETRQLFARAGDGRDGGQMLLTMPNRSGEYAFHMRYRAVGIGTDTYTWRLIVPDPAHRRARHQAVICAMRDLVLSPSGAQTARMLPHVTTLVGAICIRQMVGRAPICSGLDCHFVERLQALRIPDLRVYPFESIEGFAEIMATLIADSIPAVSPIRSAS